MKKSDDVARNAVANWNCNAHYYTHHNLQTQIAINILNYTEIFDSWACRIMSDGDCNELSNVWYTKLRTASRSPNNMRRQEQKI